MVKEGRIQIREGGWVVIGGLEGTKDGKWVSDVGWVGGVHFLFISRETRRL